MMLALVKCLFWIIKRAAAPELVLAHLSFSLFTSESLLLSSLRLVIQTVFIGSKGHTKNSQKFEPNK